MTSAQQPNTLAELNVPGKQLNWTKEDFAAKFNASYKIINEADHVEVGAVELFSELYGGRRWLHWEASAGCVCLREIWLDKDLLDHTICIKLGGPHLGCPSSIHIECIPPSDQQRRAVRVCFVMTDGGVHNLLLETDHKDKSFLSDVIDIKEGGLVTSGGSESGKMTANHLVHSHQLGDASLNHQAITSSCFLSHFAIVFGLSDGDIVYLRMASGTDEGGVCVETILRYTGVVQALWSGLMGNSQGIQPNVLVISGSHLQDSSIAVAYTADGCLSVWDCLGRVCLRKESVLELLGLADEGQGGVSVEDVKLDTCPIYSGKTCCLGIVLGITTRTGRERRWHNVVLSWSPASPRVMQQRGHLTPPQFTSSLLSTNVKLEQISLSPCGSGSRTGRGDTIASLWQVGSEVLPVIYYLPQQFSWVGGREGHRDVFQGHFVSLGPAEKHAQWRLGDSVFDQAVVNSGATSTGAAAGCRWDAIGRAVKPPSSGVSVEVDMHYLRTSFLQRLFSPGRFPFQVIVRVITQDVPYDVQQLCAEEEDGQYQCQALMDLLLVRGMNSFVEEKEESMFGFVSGGLGGDKEPSFGNRQKIESPLEILVKAVIVVCGKYEELVLDRLLQQSHQASGLGDLDTRLSTKLKRYRAHSPTLSLQAQVEVCQHILQLCEDRLCGLRSTSQSCSLLVHTRGGRRASSPAIATSSCSVVSTPFEVVVVRPSGLGVVVSSSFVVASRKQRIPDYTLEQEPGSNDLSSFVPFFFANSDDVGGLTDKERLVRLVGEEMARQPNEFALLETLLSRYVADVSYFSSKQSQFYSAASDSGAADESDGEGGEMISPQDLSETVQGLFTQSIGLSAQCVDALFECFRNSRNVSWDDCDALVATVDVLFTDLLSISSPSSGGVWQDESSDVAQFHNPMSSFAGAELLHDLSITITRSASVYYQAVACVFLGLFQKCSADPVYLPVCDLLRRKFLPTALTIVVHYAFVNWTENIHLSASRQLEKQVDFRDLVYNASLIDSLKKSFLKNCAFPASPYDSGIIDRISNNTSVMLSFWQQFSSRLTFSSSTRHENFWSFLGRRCLFAMRPSCHSDYTNYLVDVGQYSLATKSSSLSLMNAVHPSENIDPSLMQYFCDTHSLALQRITGVQMYLHDITTAVKGTRRPPAQDTVTLDPSNMEEIKQAVSLLVAMVDLPSSFSDQFIFRDGEWACPDSCVSYGRGHGPYSLEHNLHSAEDIESSIHEWIKQCKQQAQTGDMDEEMIDDDVDAHLEGDEGLLCLGEALLKLAGAPYFRVFYSSISLILRESEERSGSGTDRGSRISPDVISVMLRCYPDLLVQLHLVSLALTSHHLVDRSRTLLPLHFGVQMALHSGRVAVRVLEQTITSFSSMFNAWNLAPSSNSNSESPPCRLVAAALHYIRKELEMVLSSLYANILDISLLSCLFDEGYTAVLDLIVLHHESVGREQFWSQKNAVIRSNSTMGGDDNQEEGGDGDVATEVAGVGAAASLQWQACLRSLVVKACSCGMLQWVCDRKDVERLSIVSLVQHDEDGCASECEDEKVVDIVKEIVNQLEFVCNSSDFTDYFSGSGGDGDNNSLHLLALYDCLAAFLLSKGLRRECARVLYQLVRRLGDELEREADDDKDFEPMRILDPQSRALVTAIGTLCHEDVQLSQRYIVLRSARSARDYHPEEGRVVGDNALMHVTLADMEHMYLQVRGKISVVMSAGASGGEQRVFSLEDGPLVRALCNQGNFYDAINLGISASNQPPAPNGECPEGSSSTGRSPCLEQAITLLAEACSGYPAGFPPVSVGTIGQFASALGTNLTSFLQFEETSDSPRFLREYLVHCLGCLDGSAGNWSLHAAATAAALKAPSVGALSHSLVESHSGVSSGDSGNEVILSGNISAFLLQLLERGYLIQACATASRMLEAAEPGKECIPFTVLDRVVDACSLVLGSDSQSQRGVQLDALATSHADLLSALEKYFSKLLVVDAGGNSRP